MKRIFVLSIVVLAGLLLAACSPAVSVENNVVPTLLSTTPSNGELVLQGRYFSDGLAGQHEKSYVLLGADIQGRGGVQVTAKEWSDSRIVVDIPEGAASGYVFVFVRGARSNGLPANLP